MRHSAGSILLSKCAKASSSTRTIIPCEQFPELAEYLLDQRPPLEAQLIDLADEIAYDTADLDDGYEARLLTLPQIRDGVPGFDGFYGEAERAYPDAMEKLKFNEAVKRILDRMVGDLIRNLGARSRPPASAAWKTCGRIRGGWPRSVPRWKRKGAAPRNFSIRISTSAPRSNPEKNDAERVIRQLFDFWMAKPESLPQSYREKAGQESLPRVICDYIAGMTDNFIYEQHEKYCGTKLIA